MDSIDPEYRAATRDYTEGHLSYVTVERQTDAYACDISAPYRGAEFGVAWRTGRAHPPPMGRPVLLAIASVLTGIFLLDVMGVFIRILSDTYPAEQLSAFRNLFGIVPSAILLLSMAEWHAGGRRLRIRQWRLALFRGAFVIVAQLCFYVALTRLEFATVSALAFASPMIVTALSRPVLGDRVGPWRWAAVLIGFGGVILIMQPGTDAFSLWALLPVAAAFFYASASVTVRLIDREVPIPLVNLYANAASLSLATLITLTLSEPVWIASAADLGLIALMGICGGAGVLFLTLAYRTATPSVIAPFEFTGILFAFLLGWLVFNEAPFDRLFPGVLLIIGAGLLIVWREQRAKTAVPHPRASRRLR